MKCKVLSVQSGVSQKTNKPYSFVYVQLDNGLPVRVFDSTQRTFIGGDTVELVIEPSFDGSARVVIK